MYLIPLNQIESVDLVIHALRAAAGEADCTMCPARRVCMKQCLTIADAIQQMVATNSLPNMDLEKESVVEEPSEDPDEPGSGGPGSHLRVVK